MKNLIPGIMAVALVAGPATAQTVTQKLPTATVKLNGSSGGGGDITAVDITTTAPLTGGATCASGACSFTLGLTGGVLSGLTTGRVPVATSATTLGNSSMTDDGTNVVATGALYFVAITNPRLQRDSVNSSIGVFNAAGSAYDRFDAGTIVGDVISLHGTGGQSVRAPTGGALVQAAFDATNFGVQVASGGKLGFASGTTVPGTLDTYFVRQAAGLFGVRGTSGVRGAVLGARFVVAQAATPLGLVDPTDLDKVYTNEGATASIAFNLPTAVAGLTYTFVVQDADGLSVVAAAGDTIRMSASVSAAAGNIASTTIGNTVTLVAINATEWVAIFYVGTVAVTWTVT